MSQPRIGKYAIEAELGRGGMATVYLAHDPDLDREVAIKVLSGATLLDPSFRDRFQREARIIARLRNDAIVPVHYLGEDEGQLYLVIEKMGGGSLADRLKGRPLLPSQAIAVLRRVASALDAAHQAGVIHRDIKPDNVLFDEEDRAYVSDFGIARLTGGDSAATVAHIVGTPLYMSPEQAAGGQVTAASDVYSLGVMAFEMLTGRPPFASENLTGLLHKHVYEPPPPPSRTNPALPPEVDTVLARCLAKDPRARYPAATIFVSALADAVRRMRTSGSPHSASNPSPPPAPSTEIAPPPQTAWRPPPGAPGLGVASPYEAATRVAPPTVAAPPPAPLTAAQRAAFCLACGNILRPNARFCGKCGTPRGSIGSGPQVASAPAAARTRTRPRISGRDATMAVALILAIAAPFLPWVTLGDLSVAAIGDDAVFRLGDWLETTRPVDGIAVLALGGVGLALLAIEIAWRPNLVLGFFAGLVGPLLTAITAAEFQYILAQPDLDVGNLGVGMWVLGSGALTLMVSRFLPARR